MLKYENKRTGSLLIIPENPTMQSVEDDVELLRIMVKNDMRIIKKRNERFSDSFTKCI